MSPPPELAEALRSPCWSTRLAAIDRIRRTLDERFEERLRRLARFHLAPAAVRDAAAATHRAIRDRRRAREGRLSVPPRGDDAQGPSGREA